MLNPYEHDDSDVLAENVERRVSQVVELLSRAAESETLTVFVNDTYDSWTPSFEDVAERALAGRHPELVRPVLPEGEVLFIPKARHSAFYGTSLAYLLGQRDVDRVILAGQVTEQCVLYTALDAYIRHFEVTVARDAVACIDSELGDAALRMMERNMRAAVIDAAAIRP